MYILPSPSSLRVWHGLIFLRKGSYRRGIFPFTVNIPASYPSLPPAVVFSSASDLFHPLISSFTGELELSASFSPWLPEQHLIVHVIAHVKKSFYRTDWWAAEDGAGGNKQAKELWRRDKDEFARRVEKSVSSSVEAVWEKGGEALRVRRPQPVHEKVWERIQQRWREDEAEAETAAAADAQPAAQQPRARAQRGYLDWFLPGVDGLCSDLLSANDGQRIRLVVTAEEEKEWMEEERKRAAEERRQRVEQAARQLQPDGQPPLSEGEGDDNDNDEHDDTGEGSSETRGAELVAAAKNAADDVVKQEPDAQPAAAATGEDDQPAVSPAYSLPDELQDLP